MSTEPPSNPESMPSSEAIGTARTHLRAAYGACAAENRALVREMGLASEAGLTEDEES